MKKLLDLNKTNVLTISVKDNALITPIEKSMPEYKMARSYLASQMIKKDAPAIDKAFCEEIINHAVSKSIINIKYDKEFLQSKDIDKILTPEEKDKMVIMVPMKVISEAKKIKHNTKDSHSSLQKELNKKYELEQIETKAILSRYDLSDKDDNDIRNLMNHHSMHYLADENSEKSDVNSLQKAFSVITDPISKMSDEIMLMIRQREELEKEEEIKHEKDQEELER